MADETPKDRFTITVSSKQRGKGFNETFTIQNGIGSVLSSGEWRDGRYVNTSMAPGHVPQEVTEALESMHIETTDDRERLETRTKIVEVARDGSSANVVKERTNSEGGKQTLPADMLEELQEREAEQKKEREEAQRAAAAAQQTAQRSEQQRRPRGEATGG